MATYRDGFMGAFNGKLGPAVAYTWKGRLCLRSYQPKPKDPRTKKQIRCRIRFGTVSRLASAMNEACDIGMRGIAADGHTSVHNIFVRTNIHCVDASRNNIGIDYASLQVSGGTLPEVEYDEVQTDDLAEISVNYRRTEDDGGQNSDYVYLYAYLPSLNLGRLSLPSMRWNSQATLQLPEQWTGRDLHLYAFCWDRNLAASPTHYLGTFTRQ